MSRKSAYALKGRDAAFAAAWDQALAAGTRRPRHEPALISSQGDKMDELHRPPVAPPPGDGRRVTNYVASNQDFHRYFLDFFANRDRDSDGPSLAARPACP